MRWLDRLALRLRSLSRRTHVEQGEDGRGALGVRLLDEVRQDVGYAARLVTAAPGFSLVVILTLALGIGANTALFSVVYGVLVRPLPYRNADRTVEFYSERDFSGRPRPVETSFSLGDLEQWQRLSRSLESIALVVDSKLRSRLKMEANPSPSRP